MSLFSAESEFDRWFCEVIGEPTPIQQAAWPILRQGRNALLVASTGQGKSLAAWRPLVERPVEPGTCRGVRALHIAPLKALARDMTQNLGPLLAYAGQVHGRPVEIALRCGDTSSSERARQRRNPPRILSTTPESLYVLLGSAGGRRLLETVEAVVVDELHALVDSKRGAHLALSLARLDRLTGRRVQRIGLSATARPAETLARFLVGSGSGGPSAGVDCTGVQCADVECAIVEPRRPGKVELSIDLPATPLGAYPNTLHWQQIHQRIAVLAGVGTASDDHSGIGPAMLVFCQTRAQVERTAAALDELLTECGLPDQVGAHHGSLDTAHREAVEARFKSGALRVLVSSASLELGLDLGHVDRVCQLGVPGSVNLARQRAGRSGHRPGRTPRMHVFPLTLNQLIEARALARTLEVRQIEPLDVPSAPLDVLAQHLVAMVASGLGEPESMLRLARCAWPYRDLSVEVIESLLSMLSRPDEAMPVLQSVSLIRRDSHGRYHPGPKAGQLSLTNAGTIPEFFEYDVVRVDTGEQVGRLDEEFAFESSPGQVLQLGRRAWRIVRILTGEVRVEPADDEPAGLPFWIGEGPGRTRVMADAMLDEIGRVNSGGLDRQAVSMLSESATTLGALPSPRRLVIERFPDPGGDRHVVLHTFAGARINRAWGLALRKRFCRRFNFELQAAATDDGILISLGVTSRFELADVTGFVRSHNVADVLTQALLDTPLFVTRFRWCAHNALALLKNGPSGPLTAQRQRSQTENLIACVFPDQLACVENLSGPRVVPDHPLVRQALNDCLHDYMDLDGLVELLARIETGQIGIHAVDAAAPSRLAEALIHAPRHSFLDEAAAEERRTRNFERASPARTGTPHRERPRNLPEQTERSERRPALWRSEAGLERLLGLAGYLTAGEGEGGFGLARSGNAGGWVGPFRALVHDRRAVSVRARPGGPVLWVLTRRLGRLLALNPSLVVSPWIPAALVPASDQDPRRAMRTLAAGRRRLGLPATTADIARVIGFAAGATVDTPERPRSSATTEQLFDSVTIQAH